MLVKTAIRADRLFVSLGGTTILRGIDLAVTDGEVVALLGANGSGKSTLVRALVGIVPAEAGRIELLGSTLGRNVPWQQIGYVPQRATAGSGVPATAGEVVASGLLNHRRFRLPRGYRATVREAMEAVGLGDKCGRAVRELSGGQQQRVLIARALVRRPRLLILDEPVAGVDLTSQEAFAEALRRLVDDGTTVLVVLHELGALEPLIRRTVVLRHGAVAYDGTPLPPAPSHAAPDHVHIHPHVPIEPHVSDAPEMSLGT